MDESQHFFDGGVWFIIAVIMYLSIIPLGVIFLNGDKYKKFRFGHPLGHRLLLAVFLALVFTPSILPDWLIFFIPVPATFGLIFLSPDLLFSGLPFSDQRAALIVFYVYPLLFGFAISYTIIFFRQWCHARHPKPEHIT